MGHPMEIRCGSCGKGFEIPDGEVGAVYPCPHCATQNRASQQVADSSAKQPWTARPRHAVIGFAVGVVLTVAYLHFRNGDDGSGSAGESPFINETAFLHIADAHGENFILSAAETRTALAQMEQLIATTEGNPTLDPRIREFAELQAEYELAFSLHVATQREAFDNPAKVPLELWEMQRRYHRKARDLCKVYAPDWVSGLEVRIAEDDEIIRRLGEQQ